MAAIAKKTSEIFTGRGVPDEPSPERVGHAVKRLGIPSGRINRSSNGVSLTEPISRLVHRIAQAHRVRAMEVLLEGCKYCGELEAELGPTKR